MIAKTVHVFSIFFGGTADQPQADVLALQQQMNRIEEHLKTNDHVLIPRDQSNFDAEDDFFD